MSIPRRRCPDKYPDSRIVGLQKTTKLTVDQVDEIRQRYHFYSRSASLRALAREYGVSSTTIYNIVREKKWRFGDWTERKRSTQPKMPYPTNLTAFYAHTAIALENNIVGLLSLTGNAPKAVRLYDDFCTIYARPRPDFLKELISGLDHVKCP